MVFISNFIYIIVALLFLWLITLTIFLWQSILHYNKLTRGTGKSLKEILEKLLESQELSKKRIDELARTCDKIEKDGLFHAQKIGLVRFNPFKDTGGDQSFALALLDGNDNGVVISSLHSRVGSRWYAKTVVSGKGSEHELSEEELKAIKQAQHQNGAGQAKE